MSLKILKMPHITGKSLHLSGYNLKKPRILGKSLTSLQKSLVIFEKASNFLLKPPFL
jgi:hypothetical protein